MVMTFFIVMFILLMHFLWLHIDELVGKGLSFGVILELVMYALSTLVSLGLPLATLLASIMTMGNLGENYELLALKSAGISLPQMLKPLIILMFVISIGSFFMINNLTPYSYKQMFSLLTDISHQKQEIKFNDGIFFTGIPNMSIRVEHQDPVTNRLENVLIYNNSNSNSMQTTVADSGYMSITPDKKYLKVRLFNGEMYEKNRDYKWYTSDTTTHHFFKEQNMLISLSGFALERGDDDRLSYRSETKPMGELSHFIDSIRVEQDSVITAFTSTLLKTYLFRNYSAYQVDDFDSLPDLKKGSYLPDCVDTMSISVANSVFSSVESAITNTKSYVEYQSEYARQSSVLLYDAQVEFQRKLTLPFSIMIFFLIGAPLGAIIRKGGLGTPIVVSIGFFVIYYVIMITGERLVKDGAIPAYIGVWLSSYILFPIAVFLTYKSTNDSALLNPDSYIIFWKKVQAVYREIIESIRNKTFKALMRRYAKAVYKYIREYPYREKAVETANRLVLMGQHIKLWFSKIKEFNCSKTVRNCTAYAIQYKDNFIESVKRWKKRY